MPFDLEESRVLAAEQVLGARFPESYRREMQRANGGEVEVAEDNWQLHPIEDTSERKRLSRTANHVLKETEACRRWLGFPPEAVSIAANGSGDALVLMLRGGEFEPAIYAWSHETRSLAKVADDFSELKAS